MWGYAFCLAYGHSGANPQVAQVVGGGGDYGARLVLSHYEWAVAVLRVPGYFYLRVKGVHIHVEDMAVGVVAPPVAFYFFGARCVRHFLPSFFGMVRNMARNKSKVSASTPTLSDGFSQRVGGVDFSIRVDNQRVTVFLDGLESSALNLLDPTELEFEYMQYMTCVVNAFYPLPQPLSALHLGACACALPRAWDVARRGSTQVAVDLNAPLLDLVRELFVLPKSPALKLRHQDAAVTLTGTATGKFQVVVRDVFAAGVTPEVLRSSEFYSEAARVLGDCGLLLVNCAHGGGVDARVEAARAHAVFNHVRLIAPGKVFSGGRRGNVVLIAYHGEQAPHGASLNEVWDEVARSLRKLAFPARFLDEADTRRWMAPSVIN